jgi:hypothetical protein
MIICFTTSKTSRSVICVGGHIWILQPSNGIRAEFSSLSSLRAGEMVALIVCLELGGTFWVILGNTV